VARFFFVGGKGGVGKSTFAAITALTADAASTRTLLVTTDPASSLSAVLDVPVDGDPAPVRGARGLYAANVDGAAAFARWLTPRKDLLAAIAVRGTYLDDEDVARLLKLSLPGIDEVIGLLEIVQEKPLEKIYVKSLAASDGAANDAEISPELPEPTSDAAE